MEGLMYFIFSFHFNFYAVVFVDDFFAYDNYIWYN